MLQFVEVIGEYRKLILGVVFVVLVTAFRGGICGEFRAWLDRRALRLAHADAPARTDASSRRHAPSLVLRKAQALLPGTPVLEARWLWKHYGGPMIRDARLILLDEPFEKLAPLIVRDLLAVCRQLAAQGRTIILVEQNVPRR
ncbi:MAG TPA: hypothetical protein VGE10_08460 [Zeimonas sp.]